MDLGGPIGRLRENRDSTLKAATLSYQSAMRFFRLLANAIAAGDDEREGGDDGGRR